MTLGASKPRTSWSVVLGLVVASEASALAACEERGKQEAASLVSAVERFRRADNPGKPAAADALQTVACTAADVCEARTTCLASTEATAKALRLKAEVEAGLAALEKGALARDSAEAKGLAPKLDQAEKLLTEGHERLPACDDALTALKRRYKL